MKLEDIIGTSNCRRYQAMNCILCWFISQTVSNHKTHRHVRTVMTPLWRGMGVGCNKGILNLNFPEVWGLWRLNVALESSFCSLSCSVRCLDQTPHAACSLWQTFHTWRKNRIHFLELYTYIDSWPQLKENQNNNFMDKMLNCWKGRLLIKLMI